MLERLKAMALGFVNSRDYTMEVNLGAYAAGVLSVIVCVVWWTVAGPRDLALVAAISALLTAITSGLFKKGSNAPQQSESKGTKDEGGTP